MDIGLLLRLTLTLVVGALLAWLCALLLGLSAGSASATIVLRTLFSLTVLLLLTRLLVRRTYDGPALARTVVVAAVVSYALSPAAWAGRALIAQLVLDPGPATFVIDLVLWAGAVVLAGRTVAPRPAPAAYQPYQSP